MLSHLLGLHGAILGDDDESQSSEGSDHCLFESCYWICIWRLRQITEKPKALHLTHKPVEYTAEC